MKRKNRKSAEPGAMEAAGRKRKAQGAWRVLCAAAGSCLLAVNAAASSWSESKFATGTKNLISDMSLYLVVLCPIVGGAFAVYYLIRRSMADETDGKMWTKRIITAIICGVLGALVSGIISMVAGYYA